METFEKNQRTTLLGGLAVAIIYLVYVVFVYWFTDAYPAAHLDNLYAFVLSIFIVVYIVRENRRSKIVGFACDLGFFAYITLPLFVPYYLIKSRRLTGILVTVGLTALFYIESIVYFLWSRLA